MYECDVCLIYDEVSYFCNVFKPPDGRVFQDDVVRAFSCQLALYDAPVFEDDYDCLVDEGLELNAVPCFLNSFVFFLLVFLFFVVFLLFFPKNLGVGVFYVLFDHFF